MENLRRVLDSMSFRLFGAVHKLDQLKGNEDANIIISPFTFTVAATVLYYGSKGAACNELERVLKYNDLFDGRSDAKMVLVAFREAIHHLAKDAAAENFNAEDVVRGIRLVIANGLFFQQGSTINEDYLKAVEKNLKIHSRFLDFANDPRGSCREIENWLCERSQGLFQEVRLPPGFMDSSYSGPRMVSVNAGLFRAGWEAPFDRTKTFTAPFTTQSGKIVKVQMMTMTDKFAWSEDEKSGIMMVELPYYQNKASLVLTIPSKKSGMAGMMQGVTSDIMHNMHMKKRSRLMTISLPKFFINNAHDMKATLHQIGIKDVMEDESDLSHMTPTPNFRVCEGVSYSAIHVDEDGTFPSTMGKNMEQPPNAPTLTVPTLTRKKSSTGPVDRSNPNVPIDVYLDRPFCVAVRHNKSSLYLMVGCIVDPTRGPK